MIKLSIFISIIFLLFSCGKKYENIKNNNEIKIEKNTEKVEESRVKSELNVDKDILKDSIVKKVKEESLIEKGIIDIKNIEEKEENKYDCEGVYKDIINEYRVDNISKFGIDFGRCIFEEKVTSTGSQINEFKISNYEIILDYSQSMLSQVGTETRIEIVKKGIETFLETINEKTNIGLVVYGHKGGSECKDVEELVGIGINNRDKFIEKMNNFTPKGYAPISKSLNLAGKKLLKFYGDNYENHILLISDGNESCNGNLIEEVRKLTSNNIVVSIIGFDVNSDVSNSLKEITDISGGEYYRANNLDDLSKHLNYFDKNHKNIIKKNQNSIENLLRIKKINFECNHSLDMEKSGELIDIGLLSNAPNECKTSLANKTKVRYINISKKIEESSLLVEEKIKTYEVEK